MNRERWQKIDSLLSSLLTRPEGERAAFLQEACGGDPSLQREIELLLGGDRNAAGFLESPAIEDAARHIASQTPQPAAAADPLIGRTITHYRIVERIGGGGMGSVYKAEDTRLLRFVALKFLQHGITRDAQALSRLRREARAASALNHPNIITIYDIGEAEGGVPFIAMELIEGRTFRAFAAGTATPDEIAGIGAQVAQALAIAHREGIVHRDIKPENIMIREDGYVKILDFGLARVAEASAATAATAATQVHSTPGALLGTIRYMSPEQARGESVSAATDVFSLGLVLYELFTGKHPFHAPSQLATLHRILTEQPAPLSLHRPGLPAALEALVFSMLDKDPLLRPRAADVHQALSEMAGKPSRSRTLGTVAIPGRRSVGRQKQLGELRSAFDSAAAGRGLMVCLGGEPGLGKTTLVEDFVARLEADGVDCSIGRGCCSERLAGSEAYLPFLEALQDLLHGGSAGPAARTMKASAPAWYVQVAPLTDNDSSRERTIADARIASQERMKRELAAFLQEMSRVEPLVIFLDDLHWADNSTVDLVSYIGGRLASMRLLLIGTYRTAELLAGKHPLLQVKLDMQSRGLCREIPLEFLKRDDVDAYLALEFPENHFPPELAAMIHSKTEGNALFMADIVRYLRSRGVIGGQHGAWTLLESLPDVQSDLPESVRSMIQRKIDRLDDSDRRLLMVASVQGQEFDSAVAATASGLDAAEVEERLGTLDRVHAFVRLLGEHEFPDSTPTLRYTFVHSLYQNALYSSVTPTRRISWSAAVAQSLTGHYVDRSSEIAAELALLYEAARDFNRACEWLIAAGRNAASVSANQEAIGLFQRAIDIAGKVRETSRHAHIYKAAFELGHIYETLTRQDESAAAFRLAVHAARDMNDPAAEVQAICSVSVALFYAKRMEECREECDRAYGLVRQHGLTGALPTVDAAHYLERLSAGDFESAGQCSSRALTALRNQHLSPASLPGMNFLAALHVWRLEDREAEPILDWTLKEARQLGVRSRMIQNYFFRTLSLGHRGRMGEALQMLQEARHIAEVNGERFVLARIPNTVGWLHREMFDLEGALGLDLEGIRLAQQVGDREAELLSRLNAAQVHLLMGEHARACEHLEIAAPMLQQFNWFNWLFTIRLEAELASYWLARGELRQADEHIAKSLEQAARARCRKHMASALRVKAAIAALDDRVEDARESYGDALRILAGHPCPPLEWQIRKEYAGFLRRTGDSDAGDDQIRYARAVVNRVADSVQEEQLRRALLGSRAVREMA